MDIVFTPYGPRFGGERRHNRPTSGGLDTAALEHWFRRKYFPRVPQTPWTPVEEQDWSSPLQVGRLIMQASSPDPANSQIVNGQLVLGKTWSDADQIVLVCPPDRLPAEAGIPIMRDQAQQAQEGGETIEPWFRTNHGGGGPR